MTDNAKYNCEKKDGKKNNDTQQKLKIEPHRKERKNSASLKGKQLQLH